MKLLALDTATEACSAALYIDGQIEQRFQLAPREHTQLILTMAQELLQQADVSVQQLDALAFGRGPGSFTGVRIATGVVQGMAYAAELPVLPISTLAAMAWSVYREQGHPRVISAIDARMGQVYIAAYEMNQHGVQPLQAEQVIDPADYVAPDGDWVGVGTGWGDCGEPLVVQLGTRLKQRDGEALPRADAMVQLAVEDFKRGLAVPAAQAVPVYLRDNVAKKANPVT